MDPTDSIIEKLQETPERPIDGDLVNPGDLPGVSFENATIQEIARMNTRIEALIDILIVSGLLTEPKYEFAYANVTDFQDETAETIGEFLASRRANLVRLWRSAAVE